MADAGSAPEPPAAKPAAEKKADEEAGARGSSSSTSTEKRGLGRWGTGGAGLADDVSESPNKGRGLFGLFRGGSAKDNKKKGRDDSTGEQPPVPAPVAAAAAETREDQTTAAAEVEVCVMCHTIAYLDSAARLHAHWSIASARALSPFSDARGSRHASCSVRGRRRRAVCLQ